MNRKIKAVVLGALMSVGGGSIVAAQDAAPDVPGKEGFTKLPGDYVFKNICQDCHMPNAMGATGAGTYPALAGNTKLAAAAYPATMVLFGRRDMPPFGVLLNDTQIANVVNYVRTHFGNNYTDTVSPADIAKIRATEKVDRLGSIITNQ
jgi:mono/diheme cytochrome c family protein